MTSGKLCSFEVKLVFLRLAQLDDGLASLELRVATHFLDQFLVHEGLVDEAEVLSVRSFERRRLLIGHALRLLFHIDPGHETEIGGVAFTCRSVKLIDHAAGQTADP